MSLLPTFISSNIVQSSYKPLPNSVRFLRPSHHHETVTKLSYVTAIIHKSNNEALSASVGSSKLQVKVTSNDMIKPSITTPRRVNSVNLSLVDQMQVSYHTPIILFYRHDLRTSQSERSILLKESLSETLVNFYPLAGRIRANESIDCNDQGVEFREAEVASDLHLTTVLQNPNLEELQVLLPFETTPNYDNILLSVQVNHFSCGGMAIAVRISHKIADGASIAAFLSAWATISGARTKTGGTASIEYPSPKFDGALLFPPLKELNNFHPADQAECYTEKIISKRLTFDTRKIDELKSQLGDNELNPSSTTVQVVTAFIWKRLLMADANTANIESIIHAVNFRTRTVPPISNNSFGNFYCATRTTPSIIRNGREMEFSEMVHSVRKASSKIDNAHVVSLLKGTLCLSELNREMENADLKEDRCYFSSLCRYPFYEIDFGMGKPVWACITTYPVSNLVILSSTSCGHGVEAWIHMRQDVINAVDFGRCNYQ